MHENFLPFSFLVGGSDDEQTNQPTESNEGDEGKPEFIVEKVKNFLFEKYSLVRFGKYCCY